LKLNAQLATHAHLPPSETIPFAPPEPRIFHRLDLWTAVILLFLTATFSFHGLALFEKEFLLSCLFLLSLVRIGAIVAIDFFPLLCPATIFVASCSRHLPVLLGVIF
jgi:hypothetical protein